MGSRPHSIGFSTSASGVKMMDSRLAILGWLFGLQCTPFSTKSSLLCSAMESTWSIIFPSKRCLKMLPSNCPLLFFNIFTAMCPRIKVTLIYSISFITDISFLIALLCLTVIQRFVVISPTDVPALIKMLGPDLGKYKGKNEKMNQLIEEIETKVAKLPSFS